MDLLTITLCLVLVIFAINTIVVTFFLVKTLKQIQATLLKAEISLDQLDEIAAPLVNLSNLAQNFAAGLKSFNLVNSLFHKNNLRKD